MLADIQLKRLKPQEKIYKWTGRGKSVFLIRR